MMNILAPIAFGIASWFTPDSIYGSQPVCAMNPPIRSGMHVLVENLDNGRIAPCTVIGTGPCPFHPTTCDGRVIDLSPSVAQALRFPLGQGLTHVYVYHQVTEFSVRM